mgnify:FL=1
MAVIAERLLAAGYEVTLFGKPLPDLARLGRVLNVNLEKCSVAIGDQAMPGPLLWLARVSPRIARFIHGRRAFNFARGYDLLVYITGDIPPACPAERGILFVQFPYNADESIRLDDNGHPLRAADREKLRRIASWDATLCPSGHVGRWIEKRWTVSPEVVYPPAEIQGIVSTEKTNTILTVGRFYATGPIKKHAVMVQAFRDMCDEGLTGWKLIVAGGTHPRKDHQEYFRNIVKMSEGYPIDIRNDLTFSEVGAFYQQASIYWHATGCGEDPCTKPELFEQFGMTIVEAMACGAVPVVINGGGPAEIVQDGVSGHLFDTPAQLKQRTLNLINNLHDLEELRDNAIKRAADFNRNRFETEIDRIISEVSDRN